MFNRGYYGIFFSCGKTKEKMYDLKLFYQTRGQSIANYLFDEFSMTDLANTFSLYGERLF